MMSITWARVIFLPGGHFFYNCAMAALYSRSTGGAGALALDSSIAPPDA